MTEQPIADPAPMPTASTKSGHSTTVYHGPHNHKGQHRGHAGDPAMIDHSADSLIVQPTSTKVTVTQ